MSDSLREKHAAASEESGLSRAGLCVAVVLCIVCCALILLIPSQSINVDTVYQGF
jgi:hypothetical protein